MYMQGRQDMKMHWREHYEYKRTQHCKNNTNGEEKENKHLLVSGKQNRITGRSQSKFFTKCSERHKKALVAPKNICSKNIRRRICHRY